MIIPKSDFVISRNAEVSEIVTNGKQIVQAPVFSARLVVNSVVRFVEPKDVSRRLRGFRNEAELT